MNHRVLELLKAPKNIQSEDLHLLEEEINSFPYVQNIRALYLYGVHLYDKDNYQRVLSTTAAYTTDKKILYQLINGKIQQKPKVEEPAETVKEKTTPVGNPLQILLKSKASAFPLKREEEAGVEEVKNEAIKEQAGNIQKSEESFGVPPLPKPEFKEVFVKGERNRILFDGEENFLEDESAETIDLEATLESGSMITQKTEKSEQSQSEETVDFHESDTETPETESFTPETIVEEEKITSETEKENILDKSDLSFHETESFLSDVQVPVNQSEDNFEKETEVFTDQKDLSLNIEETADFTPETIINEDEISSVKEESVRDNAELSFHGMESFLPEVKIKANNAEEKIPEIPQPNFSKHEDEMRRLIEEVERKMKEKAASEKIQKQEEPENIGHDISFAETQSFEVKPEELNAEDETKEIKEKIEQREIKFKEAEVPENTPVSEPQANSAWKPMSFETNLPDAMLGKPVEITQPEIGISLNETSQEQAQNEFQNEPHPEIEKPSEPSQDKNSGEVEASEKIQEENNVVEKTDTTKEEAPVMNVSFFGSGWSIPQPEKRDEQKESEQINAEEKSVEVPVANTDENKTSSLIDSNVPGFINTWQSWLKIDRSEEVEKEKTEVKNKVIESFIENNPKISQLKEESNFVVKEKGDDISHLMTETLANLYFEQKLYTKAIKAFEILIKKTPEKKEYFEQRIQEIKDFRTKG